MKFYTHAYHSDRYKELIDEELYDFLLKKKASKLSWILRKQINIDDLKIYESLPRRNFGRHRKRKLQSKRQFTNLSNIQLTKEQEDLLNLGLNYNILNRDFSRYDVANYIKHTTLKAFKDIDDKQVRHLSINTLGKLTFDKYMNLHPNHEYIPNITNGELNALKE
ncbi:hypothetical protein GJ496_007752 [Pomphorhynchus laevis]|nr:hypothetical protein GJ496_007752 [Pomphorhynchus laevis]